MLYPYLPWNRTVSPLDQQTKEADIQFARPRVEMMRRPCGEAAKSSGRMGLWRSKEVTRSCTIPGSLNKKRRGSSGADPFRVELPQTTRFESGTGCLLCCSL